MFRGALKLLPLGILAAVTAWPSSPARVTTFTGYIEVNNSSTFIGDTFNTFGEYVPTTTFGNALIVSFDPSSAPFDITVTNNAASAPYPFLGGIEGFANSGPNLGSGSSNYSYLGGTVGTVAGATPALGANSFTASTSIAEDIESAIWSISSSNVLTAQWVNSNGSTPITFIVTAPASQGSEIVLSGDPTAFGNTFGAGTTDTLTFVCTAPGGCSLPVTSTPEPSSVLLTLIPLAVLGFFHFRNGGRRQTA